MEAYNDIYNILSGLPTVQHLFVSCWGSLKNQGKGLETCKHCQIQILPAIIPTSCLWVYPYIYFQINVSKYIFQNLAIETYNVIVYLKVINLTVHGIL